MSIKESYEALWNAEKHRTVIDNFARGEYEKLSKPSNGGFHYYNGFKILENYRVRILWVSGAGEYEFHHAMDVDIAVKKFSEVYCNSCDIVVRLTEDGYCKKCGKHSDNMKPKKLDKTS